MRIHLFLTSCLIGTLLFTAGCSDPPPPVEPPPPPPEVSENQPDPEPEPAPPEKIMPIVWEEYTSPEGDFSILAPSAEVTTEVQEIPDAATVRTYNFKVNGSDSFQVQIFTNRRGELATNSVQELRNNNPDILPGSLQNIYLGNIDGIEFRTRGQIGETVLREFCKTDLSMSVSLFVQKETGSVVTEGDAHKFLNSFKLLTD